MWRPANIVRSFLVFEDVRLALQGEPEGLYAGGEQADDDPDLQGKGALAGWPGMATRCWRAQGRGRKSRGGHEAYRDTPARRQTAQRPHCDQKASSRGIWQWPQMENKQAWQRIERQWFFEVPWLAGVQRVGRLCWDCVSGRRRAGTGQVAGGTRSAGRTDGRYVTEMGSRLASHNSGRRAVYHDSAASRQPDSRRTEQMGKSMTPPPDGGPAERRRRGSDWMGARRTKAEHPNPTTLATDAGEPAGMNARQAGPDETRPL